MSCEVPSSPRPLTVWIHCGNEHPDTQTQDWLELGPRLCRRLGFFVACPGFLLRYSFLCLYLFPSFTRVFLIFLLSPFLTLILRGQCRSALWDWSEEGLIFYLRLCVCVCVFVSSFACANVHTVLLVWNKEILVWIYKRIQCWIFISLAAERGHSSKTKTGTVCLFFLLYIFPPPTKHSCKCTPGWRKSVKDLWSAWSSTPSTTPLFDHFAVWRGAGFRPSDDAAHSVNSLLPFSIFTSLSASIPSSLHLLGSRNYLSPCKGASSIPWFIAHCQRNGSCFDWIEGVRAFVSLLGHSCVWDDSWTKGLFFLTF